MTTFGGLRPTQKPVQTNINCNGTSGAQDDAGVTGDTCFAHTG